MRWESVHLVQNLTNALRERNSLKEKSRLISLWLRRRFQMWDLCKDLSFFFNHSFLLWRGDPQQKGLVLMSGQKTNATMPAGPQLFKIYREHFWDGKHVRSLESVSAEFGLISKRLDGVSLYLTTFSRSHFISHLFLRHTHNLRSTVCDG